MSNTMEELAEFEVEVDVGAKAAKPAVAAVSASGSTSLRTQSFADFSLRTELISAIRTAGFEQPSIVQQSVIPAAINGQDILCQAKAGLGKTAVFVLSILQQLTATDLESQEPLAIVIAPTRELVLQICDEFARFAMNMPQVTTASIYGGVTVQTHLNLLKEKKPLILVGCPGRLHELVVDKNAINLKKIKFFVLDECDQVLQSSADSIENRRKVQEIFMRCPRNRQVMMFTATLPQKTREVARKFMNRPHELIVDDLTKLKIQGLLQYHIALEEREKNAKLNDLLDVLQFDQVIIFVKTQQRAEALAAYLTASNFPVTCTHGRLSMPERSQRFMDFKKHNTRIMVSTDVLSRGVDVPNVSIVINYDMPISHTKGTEGTEGEVTSDVSLLADTYLHRVNRAARFDGRGLAISFITTPEDQAILEEVQKRFGVAVATLPSTLDPTQYMK